MPKINIDSEKPIKSPDEDLLYRDFFASRIANMLSDRNANDHVSVALYGAPGSGKTSLLNLVEIHLNKTIKEKKTKKDAVVRFNPWLSSDMAGIRRDFFNQITAVFTETSSKSAEQIAGDIDEYTTALESFCEIDMKKRKGKNSSNLSTVDDLMTVKNGLEKKLNSSNYRIYVLIDDLDKLDGQTLRSFIRFITVYADLPALIYLLAFDGNYIANALSQGDSAADQNILLNIAHIGFEVPRADEGLIADIFFDALFDTLEPYDITEVSKSEIINLFYAGMESRLGNLSDLKRFLNSLLFHLPTMADEINIPNLIGLDFLRVFYPDLYLDIYKYGDILVGPTDTGAAGLPVGSVDERVKSIFASIHDDIPTTTINVCSRLFPRVAHAFEGEAYSSKLEINWVKEKRICSEHHFDKYFAFAPPIGKLTDKEFESVVKEVLNKKASKPLLHLIENNKIRNYFDRLIWTSDELDEETLVVLAKTVFEIGDRTRIDHRGTPEAPNAHTADYTCWWLLKRLPKPRQLEVLSEVLDDKKSLQTVLKYVRDRVITTYAEDPEFSEADINKIKTAAIDRINIAVQEKDIIDNHDLITVLFAWRDLGDEKAPTEFINDCFSQPDTAVKVLERFTTYSPISDPSRQYLLKVQPTFDFRALDVFVDIETVANRLIELTVDIENEDDIKIIEDFIRLYNDYSKAPDGVPEQPATPPPTPDGDDHVSVVKKPPPIPPEMLES